MVSPKQFTDYITVVLNVSSAFFFAKKKKKLPQQINCSKLPTMSGQKRKLKSYHYTIRPPIFLVSILYHILISFIEKSPLLEKRNKFFSAVIMYKTSFNQ